VAVKSKTEKTLTTVSRTENNFVTDFQPAEVVTPVSEKATAPKAEKAAAPKAEKATAPKAEKAAAPVSEKVATPRPEIKAVTGKNVVCKEAAAKRENKHLRQRPVFTAMSDYSITRSRGVMSTEKSVLEKAKGVIPKNLSNKALLKLLDALSRYNHISPNTRQDHKTDNKEAIKGMKAEDKYKKGKVINNQNEWGNVKFGETDMAYAGCEIFATYNAMLMLGEKMNAKKLVNLITAFEKDGAVRDGKWGTSPDAVYNYITQTSHINFIYAP